MSSYPASVERISNFDMTTEKQVIEQNDPELAKLMAMEKVANKALHINLDPARYGCICEIGAGQRVAGQFFKVGAASGTLAKTMSAYDMTISDQIYGKAKRYVCRERVEQMLDHEYTILQQRLDEERGTSTTFFTYAATISAKQYNVDNYCHGHIGLRFQHEPNSEPSDIILHVHMLDSSADRQAQALGMLGVNLIFGAFYFWTNPKIIIDKLLDELSSERIEVDFIEFSGPAFDAVENRLMNLQLIRSWCTRAVLFDENGLSQIPGNRLRKVPVMTVRGSFRPPTKVVGDMFISGCEQFAELRELDASTILKVTEVTMSEVGKASASSDQNFLSRVDLLTKLGYCVLVSDYFRFFSLRSWLRLHTKEPFAITLSVRDVINVLNPRYYDDLEGGILEGMGKLFPGDTHILVYPTIMEGEYVRLRDIKLAPDQQSLLDHLVNNKLFVECEENSRENLYISSIEVQNALRDGRQGWQDYVDPRIIPDIEKNGMFTR